MRQTALVAYNRLENTRDYHRNLLKEEVSKRLTHDISLKICRGTVEARTMLQAELEDMNADDEISTRREDRYGDEVADTEAERFADQILAAVSPEADQGASPLPATRSEAGIADRLSEEFTNLATEHTTDVPIRSLHTAILFSASNPQSDSASNRLRNVFEVLMDDAGTRNGRLHDINSLGQCPSCLIPLATLFHEQDSSLTLRSASTHMDTCGMSMAWDRYQDACTRTVANQVCHFYTCHRKGISSENSLEGIQHHHDRHQRTFYKEGDDQCLMVNNEGTPCEWRKVSGKGATEKSLAYHLEHIHGWPRMMRDAISFCHWHRSWHFGIVQISIHGTEHVDEALSAGLNETRGEIGDVLRYMCPFCIKDDSLPMAIRGHVYKNHRYARLHILRAHFYPNRNRSLCCPFCEEDILAWDFPQHLVAAHAWNIGKDLPASIDHHFDRLIPLANESDKHLLPEWVAWASNAMLTSNSTSNLTSASTIARLPPEGMGIFQPVSTELDSLVEEGDIAARQARQTFAELDFSVNTVEFSRIRNHAVGRLSKLPGKDLRRLCPFCLRLDKNSTHLYLPNVMARHLAPHLFNSRERDPKCPVCSTAVFARNFPSHLEDHGYCLSGRVGEKIGEEIEKIYTGSQKMPENKKAYLRWIRDNCPPADTPPSQGPRVGKRRRIISRLSDKSTTDNIRLESQSEEPEIDDENDTVRQGLQGQDD